LYGRLVSYRSISAADAKIYVNDGYLRFLTDYDWSFLSPSATIATVASTATSALPDNFVKIVEDFAYAAGAGYRFLQRRDSKWIHDNNASASLSSYPAFYAIEPTTFTASTGQRFQVRWFPTPQSIFTFTYRYRLTPAAMTSDSEYPMGGPMHNLTILYAALAHCESLKGTGPGTYEQLYQQYLARSMQRDAALMAGTVIGRSKTLTTHEAPIVQTVASEA
jgi:hypothetical protein